MQQFFFFVFSGVGKTSLVAKYISNISKEVGPTIGASFFTCKINLNNVKVKVRGNLKGKLCKTFMNLQMQLWDTAGSERQVSKLMKALL